LLIWIADASAAAFPAGRGAESRDDGPQRYHRVVSEQAIFANAAQTIERRPRNRHIGILKVPRPPSRAPFTGL
jgi:hypothetical protein